MRMNIARKRPIRRAFSRLAAGSRSTRIEMKMMLSMPSTSSSAVRVRKAIQTWGSASSGRKSIAGVEAGGETVAGKKVDYSGPPGPPGLGGTASLGATGEADCVAA